MKVEIERYSNSGIIEKLSLQDNHNWTLMKGEHVADDLGKKEIVEWLNSDLANIFYSDISNEPFQKKYSSHKLPVFIRAQTGKGKNYFIKHTLRETLKEYADARKVQFPVKPNILYVCNRRALLNQEINAIRKELGIPSRTCDKEFESVDTLTFITYNKLLRVLHGSDEISLDDFSVVVFDECHFFYSDAMFNSDVSPILEKVPEIFSNLVRIYMSATPENVIPVILESELTFVEKMFVDEEEIAFWRNMPHDRKDFLKMWYEKIFWYSSQYDYSSYECTFFDPTISKTKLIDRIVESKDKWLIFVTNIQKGEELARQLRSAYKERLKTGKKASAKDYSLFLDRKSRYSTDTLDGKTWAKIEKEKKFSSRVLITTSVLDNGVTLRDDRLKNIVLFTDDRTEFIQEIGRYRIENGITPHLYISKCALHTRESDIHFLTNTLRRLRDTNDSFSGCNLGVVRSMWTTYSNEARSLVLLTLSAGGLSAKLNKLAAWHVEKEEECLREYLKMREDYPEDFRIRYKAQWLNKNVAEVQDMDEDAEVAKTESGLKTLEEYLRACCNTHAVYEGGSAEFVDFSRTIYSIFRKINLSSTNYSRDYWKSGAIIRKRLESVPVSYTLEEVPEEELPKGSIKRSVRRTGGRKIITWRVIRKN